MLIVLVGTTIGRNSFDASLSIFGRSGLPWERHSSGFETLIAGSAPAYWGLCLLTGVAVFILRFVDRTIERPFSIPFFPWPAIVFCGSCLYMLTASLNYAKWLVLVGGAPLAIGMLVWLLVRHSQRSELE